VLLLFGALQLAPDPGDGHSLDLIAAAVLALARHHLLKVAQREAAVPARRAVDAQTSGVCPAPQRRLIDAKDFAGAAQAYPAPPGARRNGFSHSSLFSAVAGLTACGTNDCTRPVQR